MCLLNEHKKFLRASQGGIDLLWKCDAAQTLCYSSSINYGQVSLLSSSVSCPFNPPPPSQIGSYLFWIRKEYNKLSDRHFIQHKKKKKEYGNSFINYLLNICLPTQILKEKRPRASSSCVSRVHYLILVYKVIIKGSFY